MPYIMNALPTQVQTQAHGKWFTFKPLEIKYLHNPNLAEFISQRRIEDGLVEIPEAIYELEKTNPERATFIEDRRREGVQRRIQGLSVVVRNLTNSLAMDYSKVGLRGSHLDDASRGELAAAKELNSLKGEVRAEAPRVADEIRKELGLDGTSDSPEPRTVNSGFKNTSPSTKG